MKRRGKTLGRDVKVYGNTEIKHAIGEIGYNPIQLEYYKIYNSEKQDERKPYGIGVIKRCSNETELDVEKKENLIIFSVKKMMQTICLNYY